MNDAVIVACGIGMLTCIAISVYLSMLIGFYCGAMSLCRELEKNDSLYCEQLELVIQRAFPVTWRGARRRIVEGLRKPTKKPRLTLV